MTITESSQVPFTSTAVSPAVLHALDREVQQLQHKYTTLFTKCTELQKTLETQQGEPAPFKAEKLADFKCDATWSLDHAKNELEGCKSLLNKNIQLLATQNVEMTTKLKHINKVFQVINELENAPKSENEAPEQLHQYDFQLPDKENFAHLFKLVASLVSDSSLPFNTMQGVGNRVIAYHLSHRYI